MSKPVFDFLAANQVFYLATLEGNQPRVRPFGFNLVENNRLYFITGGSKNVARQLHANPRFELSTANAKGEWLRLAATAVFDTTPELLEKAFQHMPPLRERYGKPDSPKVEMFYASQVVATLEDMNGRKDVYNF
ncbi:MAG: pyridoxamine 5'-phosphate oxidase family protein [Planctomycetota bacterium]|jgi:uncharacterized pyridoxamine 5'-phosphate oxidase family protein|nr:pyridoxamine 5'-phosphate oxidase family protein [Planctomycetota bacterium]